MSNFEVIDGDFEKRKCVYRAGAFSLTPTGGSQQKIPVAELTTLEVVTEENATKVGAAIGWGLVGTVLMPGIGTAIGAWLKGKKEEVTLVARFKDGRKLLAVADKKTFAEIRWTYLLEAPLHAQSTTATDTSEAAIVGVSGGIGSADGGPAEDKPFTVFVGPPQGLKAEFRVQRLSTELQVSHRTVLGAGMSKDEAEALEKTWGSRSKIELKEYINPSRGASGEEWTEFVVIEIEPGANPFHSKEVGKVLKATRKLGLSAIKDGLSKNEAEEWKKKYEEVGAKVEIKEQVRKLQEVDLDIQTEDLTPPPVGEPPQQPQVTAPTASLADELKKLTELKEQGILSEDEFQAAKKKLLA